MLDVSQLTKTYPTARGPLPILADVSFSLSRGDAASIMGPSGSGKSTLLYILGALEPPTSGKVTLDGADPFALDEQKQAAFRNSQVGFVFQDHLLLPQCTVLENVLLPTLVGRPDPAVRKRAVSLLEQVGLEDRMEHRPAELSGGERQRAALARALVQELGREPTSEEIAPRRLRRADGQPRSEIGGRHRVAAVHAPRAAEQRAPHRDAQSGAGEPVPHPVSPRQPTARDRVRLDADGEARV